MHQRWLLPLVTLAAAAPAFAASNYRYVHKPEADVYFGHVSYCELKHDAFDPRVQRAGGSEPASVNLPLVPGDTLVTSGERRCEAQFDTGTVLRLDTDSGLRIVTILAPSLTTREKLTNLRLESGRLQVLYRDYDSWEIFQILTPNAAVKLHRAAVVDVQFTHGETRVSVERGSADVLYGPSLDKSRSRKIKAGQQATVGEDDELALTGSPKDRSGDTFAAWNREMDERFVERHAGKSTLPKPIERFPRAVVYFAQRYSDPFGEWIWSDLYGYVWRPYSSRDESWRPYSHGRWAPINGRMFWVPDEPWGWVPYHLGLWHWDKTHGWVWLPGSAFAPAWVSWSRCGDFRYYRPLGLWDWSQLYGHWPRSGTYVSADACGYYDGPWQKDQPATVAATGFAPAAPAAKPSEDEGGPNPIRKVPEIPLLPLPGDLEKVAKRVAGVVQHGDPQMREAVDRTNHSGGRFDKAEARVVEAPARELAPAVERFHDWNADVRAARNVGGHIVYSSVTNLVRCENCSRALMFEDAPRFPGESRGFASSGSSDSSGSSGGGSTSSGSSSNPSGNPPDSRGGERIRD